MNNNKKHGKCSAHHFLISRPRKFAPCCFVRFARPCSKMDDARAFLNARDEKRARRATVGDMQDGSDAQPSPPPLRRKSSRRGSSIAPLGRRRSSSSKPFDAFESLNLGTGLPSSAQQPEGETDPAAAKPHPAIQREPSFLAGQPPDGVGATLFEGTEDEESEGAAAAKDEEDTDEEGEPSSEKAVRTKQVAGIDATLRSMSSLSLRPTAATAREQRRALVMEPTPSFSLVLKRAAEPKPRARDVGRQLTEEEVDALLLGPNTPFGACSGRQLRALREVTEQVRYERYAEVATEGVLKASTRHFYIVVEGQVALRSDRGYQKLLGPGGCFGEITLITVRPRMMSAVTQTPCLMLRIASEELHTRVLTAAIRECLPKIEAVTKAMLLRTLPYFARLSDAAIARIVPFFSYAEWNRGHVLCRKGEPSRCIYIVAFGAVEALVEGGARVGLCTHADEKPWIGELALFKDTRRPASLRTAEPSHLLMLDVEQMEQVVKVTPSLMEIFRSAELADVYARISATPEPGSLPALRGAASVAPARADWRELLSANFFARRAHFAGRFEQAADDEASTARYDRHVRHVASKPPRLFF